MACRNFPVTPMLKKMIRTGQLTVLTSMVMLALLIMGSATPARAASEIVIEGASAEFDKTNNTITYTGNVEAKMESVAITGEILLVNLDQDRVQIITTTGKPARFSQAARPSTGDPNKTSASAAKIVYYPEKNKLELTGEAILARGSNIVSSPSIRYDILSGEVKAGDTKGTDRVEMQLLLPKVDANAKKSTGVIEE